ncbi:hypothetical protein DPMN_167805 [Dreissena polymorpha]|uniref:Uncharacterized protein n=1 Tax=Dreissena polymorpha TaxID=45954 RepID=A0A9D4IWN6_DREPO|nr:hypothetical protein DPMN_167805 [Dreissena polymorpha]
MAKCTSEYQAAYKYTTWQPPPQSLKPENEKVKNYKKRTAYMERKTTYGLDFVNTSVSIILGCVLMTLYMWRSL